MKRNQKTTIGLVLLAIIVGVPFLYSYFVYLEKKIDNAYADAFRDELTEVVSRGEPFEMKDITDFKWDRMYVFYPYTSRSWMEKAVGREWTTSSYLGYWVFENTVFGDHPLDDDSFNKIVFTRGGSVVLDATFTRGEADFTRLKGEILPEESKFIVEDKMLLHEGG